MARRFVLGPTLPLAYARHDRHINLACSGKARVVSGCRADRQPAGVKVKVTRGYLSQGGTNSHSQHISTSLDKRAPINQFKSF